MADESKDNNSKNKARMQALGYIVGAFGLVAGLAWNEAVRGLIEYLFPFGQNTLFAKFSYAIVITLFVVLVTRYVGRILGSDDN